MQVISPAISWRLLLFLVSYRQGMPVTEAVVFPSVYGKILYYRCPRCLITVEREFVAYCDRCGQHLDWKNYKHVKIVDPGKPAL